MLKGATIMTKNPSVLKWLDEMKALLTPDAVVWVDGTDEQREELRKVACELGELEKLNQLQEEHSVLSVELLLEQMMNSVVNV